MEFSSLQHDLDKDIGDTSELVKLEEVQQKKNELDQIEKNFNTANTLSKTLDDKIDNLSNELENIKDEIDEKIKERDEYFTDFEYAVKKVKWYNEKYNDLLSQKIGLLAEQKEQKEV